MCDLEKKIFYLSSLAQKLKYSLTIFVLFVLNYTVYLIFYILDGFSKKISDVDHTSNHGTSCEYAHPYFMKEHPYLLLSIKQKRGEKVVSIR